ncbi:hypothetical protein U3A55_00830 [Salarchaeum sp. III]|uniref:hypothetical protein n=1 Tax=Salarchaeum sp. III TaxID=3107927 RepID=UPI002ED9CBAE
MEEKAEQTATVLRETVGEDAMVGVSYYDEEGVGHVYRSDWAEQKYDPEEVDEIIQELRFESLGYTIHEEKQQQNLRATVRVYKDILDIVIPTNGTQGVGFALDTDAEFSIREVIDTVENALAREESASASSS